MDGGWRVRSGHSALFGCLVGSYDTCRDPCEFFLIHLYSAEYMAEEEGYSRFFAYMNLFVGFYARAGVGGQPGISVSRLGGRRALQPFAHRLLVKGRGQ